MTRKPLIILISLLAWAMGTGLAQAQTPPRWEVRTMLDVQTNTDAARLFRQSCIKQRYVCPYCSYSSPVAGSCQNPWNAAGHPAGAITLVDMLTTRRNRVLSLATPVMAANRRDLQIQDATGALQNRAVLGRPFQPLSLDASGAQDSRRSTVHAQVAITNGVLPGNPSRYRFQITPPTPASGSSGVNRPRRPMAQVDPDLAGTPPRGLHLVYAQPSAPVIPNAQLPNYMTIGLNPYRVDEGDQWFIRITERCSDMWPLTRGVRVEVCSILYGLVADCEYLRSSAGDPPIGPSVTYPFSVVADNGACLVTILRPFHDQAPWVPNARHTWTFQFMSRSNCKLMPGWDDLDTANDPPFVDLAGNVLGDAGFDFWTDNFPTEKRCWYTGGPGTPTFTDQSQIVETGVAAAPYVIPNNCTGLGTVAVQYGGNAVGNYSPNTSNQWPAGTIFRRDGGEWHYDSVQTVTNADIAAGTANFGTTAPQVPYPQLLASRFMVSRVDIPPSTETWNHGTASDSVEIDSTAGWAYPRVVIGAVAGTIPNQTVSGDYPPGSITPYRPYKAFNRWTSDTGSSSVCPTCGMIWGPGVTVPTTCPNHAGNVAPVVLSGVSGGAYSGYCDGWRTATTVVLDELLTPVARNRFHLPEDCFEPSLGWVGVTSGYRYSPTSTVQTQNIDVRIPRYQRPSVPYSTTTATNDPTNDRGYRGGRVLFQQLVGTAGWDAFFRCPDCAQYVNVDDPSTHNCSRPHRYCPLCGAEYDAGLGLTNCTFDNEVLLTISATLACRQEHLMAEEFDAYDVQVSVNRKAEVASSLNATEIGRAAPGTPTYQPDTTTPGLTNYRPFPSDVSPLGAFMMRNEGNVLVPLHLGNVYDFNPGAQRDVSLFDFHRVEIDPTRYSLGRLGEAAPITRDTMRPLDAALTPSYLWSVAPAERLDPSGRETLGFVTAGSYTGTAKPVPLGQPVGTYTGSQLHYVDSNNNNALDFYSMATGSPVAASTATMQFNPAIDRPTEPLCSVVPGVMRVTESRLPHNDYYAKDSDPVVLLSMPAGKLQVAWATNRASTDPAINASAAVGQPAPAGVNPTALPTSNSPQNLIYATATGATGGADDPWYRIYYWPNTGGVLDQATMLTADPAGTTNSAPWLMASNGGDPRWAFWHRSLRHSGGVESTLRYDSSTGGGWTWNGSSASEFIFDTGQPKQNLRGFATANGAWLFWHEGNQGHERLMYRWNFTGTTDNNEGPLAVVNQAPAGRSSATTQTVENYLIRRHTGTPFVFCKQPSVFEESGVANVFFSGYIRTEQQADICWERFDMANMAPTNSGLTSRNHGKLAFSRIDNEELRADGLRQRFGSRHLDWLISDQYEQSPNPPALPSPNPYLQLGLLYDQQGDGVAPVVQWFSIIWQASDGGAWLPQRGTYRVTPILVAATAGAVPPAAATIPVMVGATQGWYLRDPNTPAANPRPITLEIDPSAGVLQFSSPLYHLDSEEYRRLYNTAAPTDPTAVFNSALQLSGVALADTVLRADYTPYIWRVTRSGAEDDSPSAFYRVSSANRLTVFWRRSYPASEAPHFGRASFMYKALTNSIHVGRPPVTGSPTFTDLSAGGTVTPLVSDSNNGIYTFDAALDGHYLLVDYNGVGGNRTERHQIIGWSAETAVPVDTVIGEGPLAAVPEFYDVAAGANTLQAVRYWLFWSSPRAVYDMRLVQDAAGTRFVPGGGQAEDLPVHPSTDIYSAVVAPEFGGLRPEITPSRITTDPT